MKRAWLIGMIALGAMAVGIAIPAFADGPSTADDDVPTATTWERMYDACRNGDWEAMAEAADDLHGPGFEDMPCHAGLENTTGDENPSGATRGYRDHMGRGMMGGGMMGSGMMW